MSVVVVVWGAERAKENPAERVGSNGVDVQLLRLGRWLFVHPSHDISIAEFAI